jgi:acyl dehydratase
MVGLRYEDYEAGKRYRTLTRTIGETEIVVFSTLTGFFEEPFLSEHAAATGPFAARISPAALTFSIAEGLVVQLGILHSTGLAFLGVDNMRIPRPVVSGDTVFVEFELLDKRLSKSPSKGIVTSTHTVMNQREETVMTFTVSRLIATREYPL